MASITKRGTRFRAEIRQQGRYFSKTFPTKREAAAWVLSVEADLDALDVPRSETMGMAMEKYSKEVSPSKKGCRWEQIRLARLGKDPLADIPIGKLTSADLAQWRDRRLLEVAPGSVNRELNLLSAVFERARREWGWIKGNPVRDIKRPRNPRHRERRISEDEVDRVVLSLGYQDVVETAQQQVAVAFLISLETAMRLGEVLGLAESDLRLDQRYLIVQDSKNNDRREVPLSGRAIELLGKLSGRRLFSVSRDSASVLFRRAVFRAGIQDLTYHDSRHEAITRLARKLDVLDLARMVGHRDVRSLMVYYNATASEIAQRL